LPQIATIAALIGAAGLLIGGTGIVVGSKRGRGSVALPLVGLMINIFSMVIAGLSTFILAPYFAPRAEPSLASMQEVPPEAEQPSEPPAKNQFPAPRRDAPPAALPPPAVEAAPKPEELLEEYRSQLKSGDVAARRKAAEALKSLGKGAADALPDLIAAIRDPDAHIRANVIETLTSFGRQGAKAYGAVVRATADDDDHVRSAAESFLRAFGNPPVEAVLDLIALAEDAKLPSSLRVRVLVMMMPLAVESRSVVGLYVALLKSPEDSVREQAAKCLAKLGKTNDRAALAQLLGALTDPSKSVADAAAEAIDRIGQPDPGDIPGLLEALKSESPKVRMSTLRCLGRMQKDAQPAAAAILSALRDRESSVRLAAVDCLFAVAPEKYTDAAELLADPEKEVRKATAATMRRLLDPVKCYEVFADALSNTNEASRLDMAKALDQIELPSANDISTRTKIRLTSALSDASPLVRVKAAKALHRLGWGSDMMIGVLAKLLAEPNDGVSQEAAETLDKIGSTATRQTINELIRALASRDAPTRKAAAAALHSAGQPKAEQLNNLISALSDVAVHEDVAVVIASLGENAVPDLIRALENRDAAIRRGAARALGALGPKAADAYRPLIQRYQKDSEAEVRNEASNALDLIRKKP
jgi:HEAT repeat protein